MFVADLEAVAVSSPSGVFTKGVANAARLATADATASTNVAASATDATSAGDAANASADNAAAAAAGTCHALYNLLIACCAIAEIG